MPSTSTSITAFVGPSASGRTSRLNGLIDDDALVVAFTQSQQARIEEQNPDARVVTLARAIRDASSALHPGRTDLVAHDGLVARLRSSHRPVAADLVKRLLAAVVHRDGSRAELVDFVRGNSFAVGELLDEQRASMLELEPTLLMADASRDPSVWSLLPTAERVVVDDLQEYVLDEVELLLRWAEATGAELVVASHPEATLYRFRGAEPVTALRMLEGAGARVVRTTAVAPVARRSASYQGEVDRFVRDAVAASRSVAVLAPYRRLVDQQLEMIAASLPDAEVVSTMAARAYEIALVHGKAVPRWAEVEQSAPHGALDAATSIVLAAEPRAKKAWDEVFVHARPLVDELLERVDAGDLSAEGFSVELRRALSDAEALANEARMEAARADAVSPVRPDVVVTTIHAAIGQRFDCVVVVPSRGSDRSWTEYGSSRADVEALVMTPQTPRR